MSRSQTQKLRPAFRSASWKGRTVVVTAGPTREALDPVRFLSNSSSGRMGYALADAARKAGARVLLISGPTYLQPPSGVRLVPVVSAREMLRESLRYGTKADVFIAAAAVADWRPAKYNRQKIKKTAANSMALRLQKNPDILKVLSYSIRKKRAVLIGFALETNHLLRNAMKKLKEKSLDMIVANDASVIDQKFTEAYILQPGLRPLHFPRSSKESLARGILSLALEKLP